MELFYLLCSIISTSLTTLFLSLLLPFRRRRRPQPTGADPTSLYEGTVWHERRRPAHNSFRYPVRYALFDLDHRAADTPPDHLSAEEARSIAGTSGPIFLLTVPPSVGYEQNPFSLYYCYDLEGSTRHLKKCIAEVTNTPWGERVSFLFDPNSDLVAKTLHVSPFMLVYDTKIGQDMLGSWTIKANDPGGNLFVTISVQHPTLGDYFSANLTAKKVPSSLALDHKMFFWLMPHKVALWIYWQALKLWWKNVPFIQHVRYTSPAYRVEAQIRDQKLQCCPVLLERDYDKHLTPDEICKTGSGSRWIRWRDAKWPWS